MSDDPAPLPPPAAGAVPSPCISVCKMNPRTGLCEGCLRTIDEIAHWALLDDEAKRAIRAQLDARRRSSLCAGVGERK